MTLLFVYPPFCSPVSPPYSIAHLSSFIKQNSNISVDVFDANVFLHKLAFPKEHKYYSLTKNYSTKEYEKTSRDFLEKSKKIIMDNSHRVLENKKPDYFDKIIKEIIKRKPKIVAFSIIYSSQVFYTAAIIKELKKKGIKTIVGGHATSPQLAKIADVNSNNEVELLKIITKKEIKHEELIVNSQLDYSWCDFSEYFTAKGCLPIRTTTACYYQKCAFCTHHNNRKYFEYNLDEIIKTIKESKAPLVFFSDDMITKKNLLEIAKKIKPLKKTWLCQLKPTKELDEKTLQILYESGLRVVLWGVESGSQRVLDLMNKQTKKEDMKQVLKNAKKIGISNIVFIMFGFPTETKEEFFETIEFLEENTDFIDLISSSVFGLQKESPVFKNPKKYGITKIITTKRTMLDSMIKYEVSTGLTNSEAKKLKRKVKNRLKKINKLPTQMNFFREHIICLKS